MSKILSASCEAGVVTIENQVVDAEILSQGTKASTGAALMEQGQVKYIASNASDISDIVTSLGSIMDQLITVLSGLNSVSTSPGSVTAAITTLTNLKTEFVLIKDNLK